MDSLTDGEIGFAIVGCGFIAAQHAQAIAASRGGRLRVACDLRPERADALAARYGAEAVTHYEAVLGREDVDVVDICTLPAQHADMAVRAAAAGKHVLVEKPISTSTGEADRMLAACRAAGRTLAVIHQLRFAAINQRMLALLQAGVIGAPLFVDINYRTYRPQSYFDLNERGTGRLDGGGAFLTHGIHDLDLMTMFMGPVRDVMARKAVLGHAMSVEDIGVAHFQFASGALGVLSTGTCVKRHHDRTIEIHGTEGTLAHNEKTLEHYITRGRQITLEEFTPEAPGMLHRVQIQDLVDAIREDREPLVNGLAARQAVALVEAIYESCRRGCAVGLL